MIGLFLFRRDKMKIVKVFNNNIVAAITPNKKEALITGAGIGFKKKAGDVIDESKISKCYYMQNMKKDRLYQLLESTPVEYLEIAEAILEKAKEKLRKDVDESVLAALTDHIHFAIDRQKQGSYLPNLIQAETKVLYPEEFSIGLWAIRYIKAKTGIELPEDEAGYIAIHILNATIQLNQDIGEIITFIKDVIDVVEESLSVKLDKETMDYYRMTTHLKYFYQRMMKMQQNDIDDVDDMYELLLRKHPLMETCVSNIEAMLLEEYDYTCSTAEKVYLMMHILKIFHHL